MTWWFEYFYNGAQPFQPSRVLPEMLELRHAAEYLVHNEFTYWVSSSGDNSDQKADASSTSFLYLKDVVAFCASKWRTSHGQTCRVVVQ